MKYRGTRVFKAGWLIDIISSDRSRGMALGWFILIRKPDDMDMVHSSNGSKHLMRLLEHEATHIRRQKDMGRLKWFWKYWRDENFAKSEERIATSWEPNYSVYELEK